MLSYDTSKQSYWNNRRLFRKMLSGIRGVCWDEKRKEWRAYITFNGSRLHLGCFKDIEDAKIARKAAEEKYFTIIKEENHEN